MKVMIKYQVNKKKVYKVLKIHLNQSVNLKKIIVLICKKVSKKDVRKI